LLLKILKCVAEYENCNILVVYNMYWYSMEKVKLRCEYCSCIIVTYLLVHISVLMFPKHPVEVLRIEFYQNLLNGLWSARKRLCMSIFKLGVDMDQYS